MTRSQAYATIIIILAAAGLVALFVLRDSGTRLDSVTNAPATTDEAAP